MQKLEELIAALEKCQGPSLQLDGMIWCAANNFEFVMWDGAGCVYRDPSAPKWDAGIKHAQASTVRPYSASLDAAVALVNHVLPDAFWMMSRGRLRIDEPLYAVQLLFGSEEILGEAEGNSLPVTICLATLKAKLSQEGK